jgi:hypothetical protein
MLAWERIERRRRKPGLLLEWLRELGSSRTFHLAALEDPVAARRTDRLPGSRESLRVMKEAEIRSWIQGRNRKRRDGSAVNAKRKPMGRKPRPVDDLSKVIERYLAVWRRVEAVLPRDQKERAVVLAEIKPAIKELARAAEKLKVLAGLRPL